MSDFHDDLRGPEEEELEASIGGPGRGPAQFLVLNQIQMYAIEVRNHWLYNYGYEKAYCDSLVVIHLAKILQGYREAKSVVETAQAIDLEEMAAKQVPECDYVYGQPAKEKGHD